MNLVNIYLKYLIEVSVVERKLKSLRIIKKPVMMKLLYTWIIKETLF